MAIDPKDVVQIRADALREAADACTYVIKNIDILKADRETYETPRVQKIARGLVDVARQDILALLDQPAPDPVAAAHDVLAERQRQISAEGWTPEHDDAHDNGEMAGAAACYAMQVALDHIGRTDLHMTVARTIRELWPWAQHWWKPTSRRRDLVKAGALILAEIERMDRRSIAEGQP